MDCHRLAKIARIAPTRVGASSDPTTGGRQIPARKTTQAGPSMTSTLRQIGPMWGWPVGREA